MRKVNLAFLGKLAWQVTYDQNSLGSSIIRGKYFKGRSSFSTFKHKAHSLAIQKSLLTKYQVLQKGLMNKISDGNLTSFQNNHQIGEQPLREITTQSISTYQIDKTMASYWDPSIGWKRKDCKHLLPYDVIKQIEA